MLSLLKVLEALPLAWLEPGFIFLAANLTTKGFASVN